MMNEEFKVINFEGHGTCTNEKGEEVDVSIAFKSNGEVKTEKGEVWLRIIPDNKSLNTIEITFTDK